MPNNLFLKTIAMPKNFNLSFILFTSLFAAGIISCQNKNVQSEPQTTFQEQKISNKALTGLVGILDTLWIDSLSFAKLPAGKIAFQYYIGGIDTLTLHGWEAKGITGSNFVDTPVIKLLKGRSSGTMKYGPSIYLGDLILKNGEINEITKALKKNKAQYVLFAPNVLGKHIYYNILVAFDDPNALFSDSSVHKFLIAPVPVIGVSANPSPPKNFN